jgi:protein kinase-like protein/WD40 repeat protein
MWGFRSEAQTLKSLDVPQVVQLYDYVEAPGQGAAIVMELVEGVSLYEMITQRGATTAESALVVLKGSLLGLSAAHMIGIVHRDYKPENVLVDAAGNSKLSDFGVSIKAGRKGLAAGTPLYMAPEQLEGEATTQATDVYAFGLVMREAATGETLHEGLPTMAALCAARAEKVASLDGARPDLSPALIALVDRCLQPKPEDRYANGQELARAIDELDRQAQPGATRILGFRAQITFMAVMFGVLVAVTVLLGRSSRSRGPHVTEPEKQVQQSAASNVLPGFAPAGARRLTFGTSCDEFPSFTPDGESIVFDRTVGDVSNIMVMRLRDGQTRALTHLDGWSLNASVSPDGQSVAFRRLSGDATGVYIVPMVESATAPRRIVRGDVRPSWSSDGKSLWVGGASIERRDASTGDLLESYPVPAGFTAVSVGEAGPATVLATLSHLPNRDYLSLTLEERPPDGTWHTVVDLPVGDSFALDPQDRYALVALLESDIRPSSVAIVPLDDSGAPPAPLAGITVGKGLGLSRDGRHIAWSTCNALPEIVWLTGRLTGRPVVPGDPERDGHLRMLADTKLAVILSRRSRVLAPWVVDLDGRAPPRLLALPTQGQPTDVAPSRDGRSVAVAVQSAGLYIVNVDSGSTTRLVATGNVQRASFGDGIVYFDRFELDGTMQVLAVSEASAEPRVIAREARLPVALPDGRVLVLSGAEATSTRPTVMDPESGVGRPLSSQLPASYYLAMTASGDGRHVALIQYPESVIEIDLRSGAVLRRVHTTEDVRDIAYVGGELVATRAHWLGDLWLADLP